MRPFASTSPGCFRLAYERAFRQGRPRRPRPFFPAARANHLAQEIGIRSRQQESAAFAVSSVIKSFLNQVGVRSPRLNGEY